MSAVSSLIGQVAIPVSVLGAIIGNTAGAIMCQVAKELLSRKEQEVIESWKQENAALRVGLDERYLTLIRNLESEMEAYVSLLDRAFAIDPEEPFTASITLARNLGVPADEILDSREKALPTLWTDIQYLEVVSITEVIETTFLRARIRRRQCLKCVPKDVPKSRFQKGGVVKSYEARLLQGECP